MSGNGGGLHYTKSGALDMRYSSSKAAASSSSYGSSYSSFSSTSSPAAATGASYGRTSDLYSSHSSAPSSSDLHYKKDGSLDMRFSSSRETSSPAVSGFSSHSSAVSPSELHHKKDGSLDMRYSSSKSATSMSGSQPYVSSSNLHYKKDGSLDMRYGSSKEARSASGTPKQDGFLDTQQSQRSSSKVASEFSDQLRKLKLSATPSATTVKVPGIPEYVPVKADGTPDMRTVAAKDWVAGQGAICSQAPNWVPKHKDGTINLNTAVGRQFAKMHRSPESQPAALRENYWQKKLMDDMFHKMIFEERQESIRLPPRPPVLKETVPRESHRNQQTSCAEFPDSVLGVSETLPGGVLQIDYGSLVFDQGGKEAGVLGKGSFGIVLRATWNRMKVAVKRLHIEQLNRKEKDSFRKELRILAHLGTHNNLVELYGYCLSPPCIVMELMELGSLSYLLHYSEDRAVEAKMTDGRIKKNLIYGIACGMHQLHSSEIVHGDLKPQNVLVSNDYVAKITDFGLATLRGKSSSTIASSKLADENEIDGVVGGTAGYMAPELLDSTSPPDFSSDVYSFGILVNEVISEEEPYADQYVNFAGRGPFGAANYAKQGRRPTISPVTPGSLKNLITKCWSANPRLRPTFKEIISIIEQLDVAIPNAIL